MPRKSLNKGRSGEYELQGILYDQLGLTFKRDLDQYRSSDRGDLICDEIDFPFCIEVKRFGPSRGRPDPKWWDQVCAAAEAANKWPLLVYRYDRHPWRWRMPVAATMAAGLPLNFHGSTPHAELDWGYACEYDDVTTAMMIIREIVSDAGNN